MESHMNKNMELWNKVCISSPDVVKKAGRFSAIDAMSQVQAATEQFGPAGKGWGWDIGEPLFFPDGKTIMVKITLWHGDKTQTVCQYGGASLVDFNNKPDDDCLKKATTDGLTKCLSYLGFNADVFLNQFDANKYVAVQNKKEYPVLEEFEAGINKATTIEELDALRDQHKDELMKIGINKGEPAHNVLLMFNSKKDKIERGN